MTHQTVSFVKSGIRIIGYIALVPYSLGFLYVPAGILILSELIGVVEEFGED